MCLVLTSTLALLLVFWPVRQIHTLTLLLKTAHFVLLLVLHAEVLPIVCHAFLDSFFQTVNAIQLVQMDIMEILLKYVLDVLVFVKLVHLNITVSAV